MGLFSSSLLFLHAVDTPCGQGLLSSFYKSLHLKRLSPRFLSLPTSPSLRRTTRFTVHLEGRTGICLSSPTGFRSLNYTHSSTLLRRLLACARGGRGWAADSAPDGCEPIAAPQQELSEETPTAPSLGPRRPRPAVPVTCRRTAQSAPAARGLGIQTAAPRTLRDLRWCGRGRRCVRAMEHRIVGPGPYRATKLVSVHAGIRTKRGPGLSADRVFVSPRFSRAGRARVWRRDVFRVGRRYSGRRSKKG